VPYYFVQGWTPLHFSAINNHLSATELLIEKGANLTAKDKVCDLQPCAATPQSPPSLSWLSEHFFSYYR